MEQENEDSFLDYFVFLLLVFDSLKYLTLAKLVSLNSKLIYTDSWIAEI